MSNPNSIPQKKEGKTKTREVLHGEDERLEGINSQSQDTAEDSKKEPVNINATDIKSRAVANTNDLGKGSKSKEGEPTVNNLAKKTTEEEKEAKENTPKTAASKENKQGQGASVEINQGTKNETTQEATPKSLNEELTELLHPEKEKKANETANPPAENGAKQSPTADPPTDNTSDVEAKILQLDSQEIQASDESKNNTINETYNEGVKQGKVIGRSAGYGMYCKIEGDADAQQVTFVPFGEKYPDAADETTARQQFINESRAKVEASEDNSYKEGYYEGYNSGFEQGQRLRKEKNASDQKALYDSPLFKAAFEMGKIIGLVATKTNQQEDPNAKVDLFTSLGTIKDVPVFAARTYGLAPLQTNVTEDVEVSSREQAFLNFLTDLMAKAEDTQPENTVKLGFTRGYNQGVKEAYSSGPKINENPTYQEYYKKGNLLGRGQAEDQADAYEALKTKYTSVSAKEAQKLKTDNPDLYHQRTGFLRGYNDSFHQMQTEARKKQTALLNTPGIRYARIAGKIRGLIMALSGSAELEKTLENKTLLEKIGVQVNLPEQLKTLVISQTPSTQTPGFEDPKADNYTKMLQLFNGVYKRAVETGYTEARATYFRQAKEKIKSHPEYVEATQKNYAYATASKKYQLDAGQIVAVLQFKISKAADSSAEASKLQSMVDKIIAYVTPKCTDSEHFKKGYFNSYNEMSYQLAKRKGDLARSIVFDQIQQLQQGAEGSLQHEFYMHGTALANDRRLQEKAIKERLKKHNNKEQYNKEIGNLKVAIQQNFSEIKALIKSKLSASITDAKTLDAEVNLVYRGFINGYNYQVETYLNHSNQSTTQSRGLDQAFAAYEQITTNNITSKDPAIVKLHNYIESNFKNPRIRSMHEAQMKALDEHKDTAKEIFKAGASEGYNEAFYAYAIIDFDTEEERSSSDLDKAKNNLKKKFEERTQNKKQELDSTRSADGTLQDFDEEVQFGLLYAYLEGFSFIGHEESSDRTYGTPEGKTNATFFNQGYLDAKEDSPFDNDHASYKAGYNKAKELLEYAAFKKSVKQDKGTSTSKSSPAKKGIQNPSIYLAGYKTGFEKGADGKVSTPSSVEKINLPESLDTGTQDYISGETEGYTIGLKAKLSILSTDSVGASTLKVQLTIPAFAEGYVKGEKIAYDYLEGKIEAKPALAPESDTLDEKTRYANLGYNAGIEKTLAGGLQTGSLPVKKDPVEEICAQIEKLDSFQKYITQMAYVQVAEELGVTDNLIKAHKDLSAYKAYKAAQIKNFPIEDVNSKGGEKKPKDNYNNLIASIFIDSKKEDPKQELGSIIKGIKAIGPEKIADIMELIERKKETLFTEHYTRALDCYTSVFLLNSSFTETITEEIPQDSSLKLKDINLVLNLTKTPALYAQNDDIETIQLFNEDELAYYSNDEIEYEENFERLKEENSSVVFEGEFSPSENTANFKLADEGTIEYDKRNQQITFTANKIVLSDNNFKLSASGLKVKKSTADVLEFLAPKVTHKNLEGGKSTNSKIPQTLNLDIKQGVAAQLQAFTSIKESNAE